MAGVVFLPPTLIFESKFRIPNLSAHYMSKRGLLIISSKMTYDPILFGTGFALFDFIKHSYACFYHAKDIRQATTYSGAA